MFRQDQIVLNTENNHLYRYHDVELENFVQLRGVNNDNFMWAAKSIESLKRPTLKDLIDFERRNWFVGFWIFIPISAMDDFIKILDKNEITHYRTIESASVYEFYKVAHLINYGDNTDVDFMSCAEFEKSSKFYVKENVIEIGYEDLDLEIEPKKATIQFFANIETNSDFNKNTKFEVLSLKFNSGLFDRQSCEVECIGNMPLYDAKLGLNFRAVVEMPDGKVYLLNDLDQLSQTLEDAKLHTYKLNLKFTRVDQNLYYIGDYILKDNLDTSASILNRMGVINQLIPPEKAQIDISYTDDQKDINDVNIDQLREAIENTNKNEKESDIMKINDKELKQIIIDEDRKTVTAITETPDTLRPFFGLDPKPTKHVTYSKSSDGDEFDKYVGVALALVYQQFGSKEEFHKFVRESELINDVKKNKETKLAEREAKKKAAQEAHEKAIARKKAQAEKEEESAVELLSKLAKYLNKPTKSKAKTTVKKTEKGE